MKKGLIIMAAAIIGISINEPGLRTMASWEGSQQDVAEALDRGMDEVLALAEYRVKNDMFVGSPSPGGGKVGSRSSTGLKQDITHERTGPLSGVVGTTSLTSEYAAVILGKGTTTIRPVNADDLWIPIDKNLDGSGNTRFTPRALFDQFRERVKIFKSKKGNTVVFVEDPRSKDGSRAKYKRKSGDRSKGDLKGRLMFVLKDEVRVEGTDALARGVELIGDEAAAILTRRLQEALS